MAVRKFPLIGFYARVKELGEQGCSPILYYDDQEVLFYSGYPYLTIVSPDHNNPAPIPITLITTHFVQLQEGDPEKEFVEVHIDINSNIRFLFEKTETMTVVKLQNFIKGDGLALT